MNTPPPPHQPQVPARRPYGSVRLPAPLPTTAGVSAADAPTGRPAGPGRWYGPRVRLPPLSIDALRSGRRGG